VNAHNGLRGRKDVERQAVTIGAVHFVYIVRCRDGTLYTGYARDPERREKAHNSGRGARYTSGRLPVVLAYAESFTSKSEALRREWQLKRWPRAKKEALISTAGGPGSLRR
jgi:putative endonuclease